MQDENNKIQAETEENISDYHELSEQLKLAKLIKERESTESTVEFETVLSEIGITLNEL